MNRLAWFVAVSAVWSCGCSNAPLAGTMDCLFPSRAQRPNLNPPLPDELFRPRDRDQDILPPPDFRDSPPPTGGRLEGLPKIGEPFEPETVPGGRNANTTGDRMPLPAPMFPTDPPPPVRERN